MSQPLQPELSLTAVCGLFCPGCFIYIASHDPDEEKRIAGASRYGMPLEKFLCNGCRSETRIDYCNDCKMSRCAVEKGIDFCGACEEYPCAELKQFQAARPHRLELWQNQQRILEVGWERWFAEMAVHYACPQCATLNSAYHLACRACGAAPASPYGADHEQEIKAYLAKRG